MGKAAQLKLTSEQRCKAAFEKEWDARKPVLTSREMQLLRGGWDACWHYLEKRVTEEFIRR